ncbi:RidA family protein [Ruminococcaceae bacterium OttesenSCG-928-N02]|nr:RidA family protein [Ruminococcaceae bacterium OttesenSCG-928-N02]
MKKILVTDKAPAAIGPYSAGVQAGNTVYVSGQLGTVPATGDFAGDTIEAQTRQSLENMKAILEAAGYTMADVVKTTCLLADIGDFAAMNAVYAEYFPQDCPARAAFQVGCLPRNGLVEIEAIAYKA